MPQFNPEEEMVAMATFPTKPAGLECTAELWLASNMTKVATSGEIPFTATGGDKSISLPITLPSVEGIYPVYLHVFSNGQRIAAFLGDEDVVIVPAYKVNVSFRREFVCMGGHMEGDVWVCTEGYFPNEREGISTVTNKGALGYFTTIIDGWIYRRDTNIPFNHMFTKEWIDYFEVDQTRTHRFTYYVGVTGIPLDSRFFIKVKDPNGKIIADEVFITSL